VLRRGRLRPSSDAPAEGEDTDTLAEAGGATVEQILSGRVATPVDYLASHSEWIVVLNGRAALDVGGEHVGLATGDWVVLPAAVPHRLVAVDHGTTWLAVHFPA
jgi:cupin 2 domain-containing protein